MNWYLKISQNVRYFRVRTGAGTFVVRAFDPDHIYRYFDSVENIEEISHGDMVEHERGMNPTQNIFASKAKELTEKALSLFNGDGLEVFYRKDQPEVVFLSFGDWAEHHDETLKLFESGGCKIEDWDYEVGSPGDGWVRIKGTRIGDNL